MCLGMPSEVASMRFSFLFLRVWGIGMKAEEVRPTLLLLLFPPTLLPPPLLVVEGVVLKVDISQNEMHTARLPRQSAPPGESCFLAQQAQHRKGPLSLILPKLKDWLCKFLA
jgi:hypothetical protein